jgi:hypothetical protein
MLSRGGARSTAGCAEGPVSRAASPGWAVAVAGYAARSLAFAARSSSQIVIGAAMNQVE